MVNDEYNFYSNAKKWGMRVNEPIASKIIPALNNNGGHCPCSIVKSNDTICPCKTMRTMKSCHCGVYVDEE